MDQTQIDHSVLRNQHINDLDFVSDSDDSAEMDVASELESTGKGLKNLDDAKVTH